MEDSAERRILLGFFVESHKLDLDIEEAIEKVKTGLMGGGGLYESPSAGQKPRDVDALDSILDEAKRLLEMK